MATEATATPAAVETTSTAVPADGTTTTTATPALPGLAEAVADYQGHRARVMGKAAPAVEKITPAEGATAETTKEADKSTAETPAAEAAKPAEPAKEAPKPDEISEGMVRILRQTRALDRQRKEIEAEKAAAAAAKAAAEAERADNAKTIEAARKFEEMRKKDPVSATMELLGKDTLNGTFPLDLINRLAEQDGPPTPEQIAEIATAKAEANIRAKLAEEAKIKEEEAAAAKAKAEADRTADLEQKKTAFFTGLARQLSTDSEKYPYLVAKPVEWEEVDKFIVSTFSRTGKAPAPEEIFKHFDGEREKDAAALAAIYNKRNAKPAAVPAPKTSTARASTEAPRDTRGRVETPPAGETQRERLDRVARELNQQSFGH
jgi:hypothetical protein